MRNPVCRVKFFKESNIRRRILDVEEEKRLSSNAAPFLNTGLRVGELFTLQWSHVDMEKNILNVFAPKTGKTRPVPINTGAKRVLEAWALGKKNDFVFYNHDTGKPFVDLKAGFALACRRAGISGVTWHTLRHTFASRLLERGVDIVTIQQLLGHSTVTVTMRYTHTNLDSKRAAVDKLAAHCDKNVTIDVPLHQHAAELSHSPAVSYTALRA